MIVGAAGDDVEALGAQAFGKRLGILDHIPRIDFEVRTQRFGERHRLRRDHMHQRSALQPREDRRIELLGQRLIVPQHQPAARAAQRFVRRRRRDMRIRHRRGMRATGDEACEMRHIDHEIGAD